MVEAVRRPKYWYLKSLSLRLVFGTMKLANTNDSPIIMSAPVMYGTNIRAKLMPLSKIEVISLRDESFEVNHITLMKVNSGMNRLIK